MMMLILRLSFLPVSFSKQRSSQAQKFSFIFAPKKEKMGFFSLPESKIR